MDFSNYTLEKIIIIISIVKNNQVNNNCMKIKININQKKKQTIKITIRKNKIKKQKFLLYQVWANKCHHEKCFEFL